MSTRRTPQPTLALTGRVRHPVSRFLNRSRTGNDAEKPHTTEPRHWIASSARDNTDQGMVIPSALAAFRLITNSYLVGCSTGSSAGLAPFMIRSTYVAAWR